MMKASNAQHALTRRDRQVARATLGTRAPGSTRSSGDRRSGATGSVRLGLAGVIGLACAAAAPIFVRPTLALAQDMSFSPDEVEGAAQGDGQDGDALLGELSANQASTGSGGQEAPQRLTEAQEEIYAVQQIYALRINRVELAPSISFTINDQYVSRTAPGVALNYWFTNVLAVGLNFLWYQGLESESDLNFDVRRSTRLAVPITQYQLGAHLNFTYVPLYGKFAMFNEFIFQWDAYLVGGLGMLRTRPVPVVDPEIRTFDYGLRIAFNIGLGLRVFVSRWLAVFAELRNYMYLEQLENLNVALGEGRTNPDTWLADSPSFTNNVTAHLGLTIFFPFTFEYKLPR